MPTLDSSHRVLLENLETFLTAQQCLADVDSFIWQAVRDVEEELTDAPGGLPGNWKTKENEQWFQFDVFPDWSATGVHFLAIGFEYVSTVNLLRPDSGEACRAFVYSHILASGELRPKFPDLARDLRSLVPPKGYSLAAHGGYVFTKVPEPIGVETMMTRAGLKQLFLEPMQELIDWLVAQRPKLEKFGNAAGEPGPVAMAPSKPAQP